VNILSYNIFMRPSGLFSNDQIPRANLIPLYLPDSDVIIFEEAFDAKARVIINNGLSSSHPYRTNISGPGAFLKLNGGVYMASKYPIVKTEYRRYGNDCAVDDCFSDKAVQYAKINLFNNGTMLHVFGTHAQAGSEVNRPPLRKNQFGKIREFISDCAIPHDELVIIAGDMNVDHRSVTISRVQEYLDTLNVLNAHPPLYVGPLNYTFDSTTNSYVKKGRQYLDYVLYSRDHKQPTYAEQRVIELKTNQPWKNDVSDLSDHYPVLAHYEF
ncbi:unnamed protein product, partial [Didymodactylos carnosus]